MAGPDSAATGRAILHGPASKRRRVSSSPDELTEVAAPKPKPTRRVSSRRRNPSLSPSKRGSLSEDELNDASYSRPITSRSESRSRSRTRSPPSQSPSQARSRLRSPSPKSKPRARLRSESRLSSKTRTDESKSRSRSRSRSGSISKSRPRSRSSSSARSNRTSSPQSLSEQVDRQLHLTAIEAAEQQQQQEKHPSPSPPPRQPVKPNYRPCLSLIGHTSPVSQVRFSPDGRWIASASADGTVRLWDATSGTHMDTLVGHMAGVSCLAWSPDSRTLASGSDDKAIRLWDRVTGRPKLSAKGVSGAKDGVARPMPPMRGHHNYVMCIAFSPKGNILASGSYDEAVFLWDVRAGRLMRSLPAHSDPVSGIDFCLDGTLVVSCSTDGLIRIWDTYTGQCLRTLVHEDNPAVTAACFSPNGRYVLAFNLDNCIRLWDYVSGAVKKTYQGHSNSKFAVGGCFGLLPLDGSRAAQSQPQTVDGVGGEQMDVEEGEEAQRRENNGDQGNAVGMAAASAPPAYGAFIASASEEGDVVLWDVTSKEVLQRISAHPGHVCFWVDVYGDAMVTAGQDGSVRLFKHRLGGDRDDGGGLPNGGGAGDASAGGEGVVNEHGATTSADADGSLAPVPTVEMSESAEPDIKVEEMDVDGA